MGLRFTSVYVLRRFRFKMASECSFLLCLMLIIRVFRDKVELTYDFYKTWDTQSVNFTASKTCLEAVWVVFFEIPSN